MVTGLPGEKEVKDAVVEEEIKTVAEVVKDEMPGYTEEETESVIEDLEINPEEKEKKGSSKRLREDLRLDWKTVMLILEGLIP